jgi:hypothetical protein
MCVTGSLKHTVDLHPSIRFPVNGKPGPDHGFFPAGTAWPVFHAKGKVLRSAVKMLEQDNEKDRC